MEGLRFSIWCLFLVLISVVCGFSVATPPLPGPFAVGTTSLEAIDYSRQDPLAPTPGPRALMVSLFYPTTDVHGGKKLAPYLPNPLAAYADVALGFPTGFTESIRTQSFINARVAEIPDIPIILFSPGLGGVRELYTILYEGLASNGYLVITIDHTYDAALVQFPDGTVVVGDPTLNGTQSLVDIRTKDTLFVLSQLSNATWVTQIPGIVHRRFTSSKIAMFGHSLGGSTTLQALEQDDRILGGCGLDPPLFPSEIQAGTKKPFLLVGRDNHTRLNDPDWAEAWKHLGGWKADLTLANSTHFTFVDESAILTEIGIIDEVDPGGFKFGTINGLRATVVEITYLKAFFDFVLKGKSDEMFKHPDPAFPEISIV